MSRLTVITTPRPSEKAQTNGGHRSVSPPSGHPSTQPDDHRAHRPLGKLFTGIAPSRPSVLVVSRTGTSSGSPKAVSTPHTTVLTDGSIPILTRSALNIYFYFCQCAARRQSIGDPGVTHYLTSLPFQPFHQIIQWLTSKKFPPSLPVPL